MTKINWKKLIPHIVALAVFVLVSVVYCSPVLDGKTVGGSDMTHWQATVHPMDVYKSTHGHYPLWTNNMFGGMPAFLIAMDKTNPVPMAYFLQVFNLFLPTPISYFFLMCISFYFLALVLRVNPWLAILGGLGYAYASFSAVLVIAGHQTEIWAMGYVPFLLGALVLLFEGRYGWGTALTALFTYLLVSINHIQIAYYCGLMAACMGIAYLVQWIRNKQYKQMGLSIVLAMVAGGLGVMSNAGTLLTNYDYSKETLRNGALTLDTATGKLEKSKGLDVDYAFTWSEGITETFTLVSPNVYGGGSGDPLPQDGKLADAISNNQVPQQLAQQLYYAFPAYWGNQLSVAGPVYLGAVMIMLVIFSLFYLKSKHKWWLVSVTVLAILLSWGKNFAAFNDFMFYHFPLYDKFRSPTMSLVIPQLTFPLLAVLGLQQLFYGEKVDKAYAFQQFKKAAITAGVVLLVLVGLYMTATYKSSHDLQLQEELTQMKKGDPSLGRAIVGGAAADRQALFGSDLLRTILFVVLAAGVLFIYIKGKMKAGIAIAALTVLSFIDLIMVDTRYLNHDTYKDTDEAAAVFNPSPADQEILKDPGYFRVMNTTTDAFEDAITSYYHNTVGGYHAAKLALFQDVMTHQLTRQPMNMAVYDMFNTKYFIVANRQTNQVEAVPNPGALGPCWLVQSINYVDGPGAAMKALDNFNPRDTAIVDNSEKALIPFTPQHDTTGFVHLVKNDNDVITYESNSGANEFAVFSEIYYSRGWKAYIDGKEAPIVKTDYLLRGLALPAGKHDIRFEFHPTAYYTGLKIAGIGSILTLLLLIGAIAGEYRKKSKATA
ncbi:YfhO family protein [Dinghuibacter silviterrae]|uniref:Membrane protein YfhO n=1 Tax=Dinghuibacter silviterrae TaxID=1539049 RepID=A0A4R8DHD2_9BACT|nr:YfhO family protein [Dinghuibacter silviterrae]TDW96644.1 membrane protein YfhO [Dinghuibacter silviterrae]